MSGSSTRERAFDPNRLKILLVLGVVALLTGARLTKTAQEKLASLSSPRDRGRARSGLLSLLRFDEDSAFQRRLGARFAAFDAVRRSLPPGARLGIVGAGDSTAAFELARDCEYLLYPLPVAQVPDWEEVWNRVRPTLDPGAWVLVLDPTEPFPHAEHFELVEGDPSFALYRFAGSP